MALYAVIPSGVDQQPSPSTSDVEKAISWPKPQFSADAIKLGRLCVVQRSVRGRKIAAGIHHLRIEKQRIEIVRDVVMKTDQFVVFAPLVEARLDLFVVGRRAGASGGREQERQRATQCELPIEVLRQIE